ncbi:MAG: ABC transporter permease [Planctomycetota bacterium]
MSAFAGILLVARQAFTQALRGPRAWILCSVAALPVGMALLIANVARSVDVRGFVGFVMGFVLQIVVPFIGLLLGAAVLGDEIEGRTITYLFTRPLPRPVFFLGRLLGFFAAFGAVVGLAVGAVAATYRSHVDLSAQEVAGVSGIAVAGFLAYLAFFAALRTLFRRALFVGFLLVFIFEVTVSKIPGAGIARLSVWHHMIVLLGHLLDRHGIRGRVLVGVAPEETPGGSLVVLAAVLGVSLALGAWNVHRREVQVPAAAA